MGVGDPMIPKCPSAQPGMTDVQVLGVVSREGGDARVLYLNAHLPASAETLAMAGSLEPTEIFRLASRCEQSACTHFSGERCSLVDRIVAQMAPVVAALPACVIRPVCRWHQQTGAAACRRCPQIVTTITGDSHLAQVAVPRDPADTARPPAREHR